MKALCAFLLWASAAAASPLSGTAITALLSGNTALGHWHGAAYRQLFRADGSTIYAQKVSRSALGHWRINPDTDAFETLWPGEDWTAYEVIKTDTGHAWIDQTGKQQPFRVLPGQHLTWPD